MTGLMLLLVIPGIIANWSYAQAPSVNNTKVSQSINQPLRVDAGVYPYDTKPNDVTLADQTSFIWPVDGHVTSGFGYRHHPIEGGIRFHSGIDIAANYGTTIFAAQSGRVLGAGWNGLFGKCVIIQHDNDFVTLYGHCSRTFVQVGQRVERGQAIALVGSTGLSTGPHVHFEIRQKGVAMNPINYMP
jgi:murein DD-endopeptidase MepM/ murein hydrolase activator NlpD